MATQLSVPGRQVTTVLSVASGKGGTGKTTVAVNLAIVMSETMAVQLVDADVEEPNAHIFLKPTLTSSETVCVSVPEIDEALCTHCGKCSEACAFNAIMTTAKTALVFEELCHGCGTCRLVCPSGAIRERQRPVGAVEAGHSRDISFVQGRLKPGEVLAPAVVRAVKRQVDKDSLVFIDCSPGTSCPVVQAVRKTDACLLVTEPTPFGLHDLKLAVEMLEKLQVPAAVILNRADVGDGRLEAYCQEQGLPVLGRLPFSRQVATSYARGVPIVDESQTWRDIYQNLAASVSGWATRVSRLRRQD